MSTIKLLKKEEANHIEPDYKDLYFATMGKLAEICEAVIKAQRDIEERYLKQTDTSEQ